MSACVLPSHTWRVFYATCCDPLVSVRLLFFFFSSRRRHTRSLCDWSSDVCSSDLYPSSRWPLLSLPRFGLVIFPFFLALAALTAGRPRLQTAVAASSAVFLGIRSEEHTSELQSHSDLVCRLLLEKKKQYK